MRKLTIFAVLLILTNCSVLFAQQIATTEKGEKVLLRGDKTWEYINKNPNLNSLRIQAGLVFQSGDVVPVSRTKFYLFNKNAGEVLINTQTKQAVIEDENNSEYTSATLLKNFENENLYQYVSSLVFPTLYPNYFKLAAKSITDNTIYSFETDFQGNAEIKDIKSGIYYLFGYTKIRKNTVFWNLKVNLDGDSNIVLDQNNAN